MAVQHQEDAEYIEHGQCDVDVHHSAQQEHQHCKQHGRTGQQQNERQAEYTACLRPKAGQEQAAELQLE